MREGEKMDNIQGNELSRILTHIWTKYENKLAVAEQLALSLAIAAVHYCESQGKEFMIKGTEAAVVDKQD